MGLFSNKVHRRQFQPGDHIYSYRLNKKYAHHGIYVGADRVIHYTKTQGGSGWYGSVSGKTSKNQCKNCGLDPNVKRGVIKTCIDCFLSGHDLYRYEYDVSFGHFFSKRKGTCTTHQSDPEDVVISRATNLLNNGFGDYDLYKNNCECFAFFCKTHRYVSQQALEFRQLMAMELEGRRWYTRSRNIVAWGLRADWTWGPPFPRKDNPWNWIVGFKDRQLIPMELWDSRTDN